MVVVTEIDVAVADGRTLHAYHAGEGRGGAGLTVLWHHGTPNTGEPPEPLLPAAAARGQRWVSYDRPGYGGSTARPGRDVASAGADAARVADALGIDRFAVMGYSGGAPHALACAALLPERVVAVVCLAGMAPRVAAEAEGLDWFSGMAPSGAAELRAAVAGRAALSDHLGSHDWDPEQFTVADHAALAGDWAWLGAIAGAAASGDPGGMVDDDLAYVAPWGFDPGRVRAPVLLVHGDEDRVVPSWHGRWLADRIGSAELRLRRGDGHVSVLGGGVAALDWLRDCA